MQILLIEDEPIQAMFLTQTIMDKTPDAQCSVARTVEQARGLVNFQPFDLISFDLHLPDGNSLQLLPDVVTSVNNDTPRIIYSAYSALDLSIDCVNNNMEFFKKLGFSAFVSKGVISATHVADLIRRLLDAPRVVRHVDCAAYTLATSATWPWEA